MFRRMTRERYLSDPELARFIAAVRERRHVHQPRDYALFSLLANTGMRPAEVRALTRGDCHLEGAAPWVRIFRLKKKKTVREFDDLPIPAWTAEAVSAHLTSVGTAPEEHLFAIAPRQMQRLFKGYCRLAGVRPINLYSLRHTVATRLYCATRNIRLVQAVLGHEKPNMTALYVHVPDRLLKELARSFPAIV
jgi:integrase/recombinase XerD